MRKPDLGVKSFLNFWRGERILEEGTETGLSLMLTEQGSAVPSLDFLTNIK